MNTRNGSSRAQAKSTGSTGSKAQPKDSGDLEMILDLARFEIEHDPYRGIGNADVPSPWFGCRYSEEFVGDVSRVVMCSCPSLIHWSREAEALKKRRKRKRTEDLRKLGRRRDDLSFETPCDYNPFCLASLGGVMDDFLEELAVKNLQVEDDDDDDNSDVVEVSAEGVEIIDVEKEPQKKQAKSVSNEDELTPPVKASSQYAETSGYVISPPNAYLDEVSFSLDELDHTKDVSIYSKLTREQLLEIRKEIQVDRDSISHYVQSTILAHIREPCSPEEYCDRIQSLHGGMLLRNPLCQTYPRFDKIKLALPPGIKNLGATCYLNTQLQCLARNTAFLDGIFAWRPSQSESRMDSVLSTLQQLLARLTFGAQATITTEAFSTALGLQTDEMQDPNEFGRLLLQKMHEAFQEMSAGTDSGELSNLLPSLFEGTMTYETKCLHCESVRERNEKFMDINLPIVRPEQVVPRAGSGQQKLEEAFAVNKKDETSLQYCLESYMQSEQLTGDNQYWCEECQQKQDASRQVVLQELPPVLNVQLSRYIYDRVKQTKKKVMDKVTLPLKLKMRKRQGSEPRLYILCAVMKHLGNSAYRGHYVAEAMDWQTGTWYEFNDEKVSILESGPSCSSDELCPTAKTVKGSQDAYNMYYVNESYLGKAAMHSLGAEQRRADDVFVKQLVSERHGRYEMLVEMCRSDGKASEQEKRRKQGLLSLLRSTFLSGSKVEYETGDQGASLKDAVWIDGALLRSLFACAPDSAADMLNRFKKNDALVCEHKSGMHPSKAHRGKLLSKKFSDGLLLLLRTELNTMDNTNPDHSLTGLFESSDICCDQCANQYKASLQAKLSKVEALQVLHNDLDPKRENDDDELDEDEFVYAVSKKFIGAFRKSILLLLKKVQSFHTNCGGLDTLEELDCFPSGQNEFDNLVNSTIVCENGKCCPCNKRSVRYVTKGVWNAILSYFPGAISLGKRRSQKALWLRCEECEGMTQDRESLEDWASIVASGISLRTLAGRQKPGVPAPNDSEDYFVVHRKDIVKIREACRLVERNPNMEMTLLRKELSDLMFGQSSLDSKICDVASVVLAWQPIPLTCQLHSLALNQMIFSRTIVEDGDSWFSQWSFTGGVTIMPSGEYRHYVLVVLKLYELLLPSASTGRGDPDLGHPLLESMMITLNTYHPRVRSGVDDSQLQDGEVDGFSSLECFIRDTTVDIRLSPAMCASQQCNSECIESLKMNKTSEMGAMTIVSQDEGVLSRLSSQTVVAGDNEVQIVEVTPPLCQRADEVSIRIVEVDNEANLEEVAQYFSQKSSIPGESTVRRSGRKRKQRFALGPIKNDDTLRLRWDHNMAAVRLHILEKDPHFRLEQSLALFIATGAKENAQSREDSTKQLISTVTEVEGNPDASSSSPALPGNEGEQKSIIDIPFEMNEKSIRTIVTESATERPCPEKLTTVFDELILIRRAPPALLKSKRLNKTDEEDRSATLMDSLLQVANLTDEHYSKGAKTQKSSRCIERGFTGTFLNTNVPPPVHDESMKKTLETDGDHENDLESQSKQPVCVTIDPCSRESSTSETGTTGSLVKQYTSTTLTNDSDSSNDSCNNNSRHGVVLDELVKAVESNGTGNADEAAILNAVSWSINQNPASAGIRDLTDAAYAKYLEAMIC